MDAFPPSLDYGSFTGSIVEILKQGHAWHRVVSIDLETKIEKREDFLPGERLLAVGFARRESNGGAVEVKTLRLKDDSDDAEIELLNESARWLAPIRPLVLLGYNIAGYDYPLLCLKQKWYDDLLRSRAADAHFATQNGAPSSQQARSGGEKAKFPREYWALKDALTRAYILDMMHPLRYALAQHDNLAPKYKSLADVVAHQRFADVKLMRRKQLAQGTSTENKGQLIYKMWKENNPDFERYLEGDVHDVLLLAESLYGVSATSPAIPK